MEIPLRNCALGVVTNNLKEFLIVNKKTYSDNEWNFPGGGVDEGETPEQAVLRELSKELGTDKFYVLGESSETMEWAWSEKTIMEHDYKYSGQRAVVFLIRFLGQKSELKLNTKEIRKCEWVTSSQLKKHFVFPGQYKKTLLVLEDLKNKGLL